MVFFRLIILSVLASLVHPAAAEDLLTTARSYFEAIPQSPPALEGNPASKPKLDLGRMLYFEPRLSLSHAISCHSCHQIGFAGTDRTPTSVGHNWHLGPRNSPTTFNAVFNLAQFWDGRATDLEDQAGGPFINEIEMAASEDHVLAVLRSIPEYRNRFAAAFPDHDQPVTLDNVKKAIAVFEARLITPDAPFDRYLEGDASALTERQKTGLRSFIDIGCTTCHNGVAIGGNSYQRFGLVSQPSEAVMPRGDTGRQDVTGNEADRYVFKVPTLRNVALTAPYFHSGAVWDLDEAVEIMARTQLGAELSEGEIDAIVDFLESLTGRQPAVQYPILPASTAATPKPVR